VDYDHTYNEESGDQVYYEPVITAAHSGFEYHANTTLGMLLREGLLTVLVLFFLIGLPAWPLGTGTIIRIGICVVGLIVTSVGILAARTLGGRVLQVFAFAVIFEQNYAFQAFPVLPSTVLLVLVIFSGKLRHQAEPVLLWRGNTTLRSVIRVCVWMMLFGMFVAAMLNGAWLRYSLIGMMNLQIPAILFGVAGAMMLRRGSAGVFLDVLPFLATVVAITVWIYTILGIKTLYFQTYSQAAKDVVRYGGLLRNPNNTGCLCAAMALLGFARLRQVSGKLKPLLILNSLFLLGTVFHLRSRGPLLVLGIGAVLVLLRKGLKKWAVVIVIFGVIGYSLFGGAVASSRSKQAHTLGERISGIPRSIGVRLNIYAKSISLIPKYPLGYGQVEGVLSKVEAANIGMAMESHNEYITFALQNGLQTVLPATVLAIALMASWIQSKFRKEPHRPGLGVAVLLLCLMITASFEPIYNNCQELGMLFGVTLGMIIASVIYARPQVEMEYYPLEDAGT